MTSLLKSNSDKPHPSFRSETQRWRYRDSPGRFVSADPIHLENGSAGRPRPEAKQHFVKASPVAFRRGNSRLLSTAGGSQ